MEQKGRLLYLLQYLDENTDEQHKVSTYDLIDIYDKAGYKANRKTVKDDIDILIAMNYGVVANNTHGGSTFYMGERDFEPAEIKILMDAVSSSKFISKTKSEQLIRALGKQASKYERKMLNSFLYPVGRIKPDNKRSYINMSAITEAIEKNKKIEFKYYEYNADKQKVFRHNGEVYVNSPYAMIWNDDFYYLLGYSEKRDAVITFRVDRISAVKISDEDRIPAPKDFDPVEYANKNFEMYAGEETEVMLICKNELMKLVIDKFGDQIDTHKVDENTFAAKVSVSVSKTFYSWVFTFDGDIRISGPKNVKEEYTRMLKKSLESYV